MLKYLLPLLCMIVLLSCKSVDSSKSLSDNTGSGVVTYVGQINNEKEYEKLMFHDAASKTTFVKFTIDHKIDGKPAYYQNTTLFPFHDGFLKANIDRFKGRIFTQDEILWGTTKEVTGGAIYYAKNVTAPNATQPGVLGFMIYPEGDDPLLLNLDEVAETYAILKKTIPFAANQIIYLFPTSQGLLKMKSKLQAKGVPSMLFQKIVGQGESTAVYNAATSYGYLKKLTAEEFTLGNLTSKDIIILDQVPLDIGPLAGIITTEIQVPHSHVIFRAVNQKIPDVYLPNALSLPSIIENIGKLVEFNAGSDGSVTIRGVKEIPNIESLAKQYFDTRVPALPPLKADVENSELFFWKDKALSRSLVLSYGTKASNFAIIDNAERAAGYDRSIYDGSFLVPFYYYQSHLKQPVTDKMCAKALADCNKDFSPPQCTNASVICGKTVASKGTIGTFLATIMSTEQTTQMLADTQLRKAYLDFAQKVIEKADLSAETSKAIKAAILKNYPETTRMRFRSSTNAEDLPGLNGAGFYVSKAACLADEKDDNQPSRCQSAAERTRIQALIDSLTKLDPVKHGELIAELKEDLIKKKPLDKAIKKVFASVWTEKAFLNRDYYRIDHMMVSMGILVHPSYADELANGVLVATTHPQGDLEVNIVAQTGDTSITNPEVPGATPDQFIITRKADGSILEPRFILRSNQTSGGNVLSVEQANELVQQVFVAGKALREVYGPDYGLRLDVEFKVDGAGKVHMKQGRPL